MASSSVGGVNYISDPVHRHLDAVLQRDGDMQQTINSMKLQVQDLASTFVDIGDADKVLEFRDGFKDLLNLENEVNMHTQALQASKRTYQASEATTDFASVLERKKQQLLKSHRFDPEASNDLKNFDKEVGHACQEGGDDDVVDTDGNSLRNDKCPLTLKPVLELQDPVADSQGFIYEKAAIFEFITDAERRGQPAKCPMAGTTHVIKKQDMRPATQLERVKRRKMLQTNDVQRRAGTVYDVDDA